MRSRSKSISRRPTTWESPVIAERIIASRIIAFVTRLAYLVWIPAIAIIVIIQLNYSPKKLQWRPKDNHLVRIRDQASSLSEVCKGRQDISTLQSFEGIWVSEIRILHQDNVAAQRLRSPLKMGKVPCSWSKEGSSSIWVPDLKACQVQATCL